MLPGNVAKCTVEDVNEAVRHQRTGLSAGVSVNFVNPPTIQTPIRVLNFTEQCCS